MAHFQPFPGENFIPKRSVFDHTGSRRERPRSLESQSQDLQQNLEALGIRVTKEQTQESLSNLRSGLDLQQTAQEREGREVNELVRLAEQEGALDSAETRDRFMADVQQRLSVVLAMLVNDGELTDEQLSPANIAATLTRLENEKGNLKVSLSAGERNLFAHEQGLLGVPSKLAGHPSTVIQTAWIEMSRKLGTSVRWMRAAAAAVSEQGGETSWSEEAQEVFDKVKEQWEKASPATKGIAIAAGAVGALWLLNKMFNNGSGSGSMAKILGIGALIAGGVYIAGKYMSLDTAFETLGKGFENLKRADFVKGMEALAVGDVDTAKRHLGEAYETIRTRILGERTPAGETVDEEGVYWESPELAVRNYVGDLAEAMRPVTGFINRNQEAALMTALLVGSRHAGFLISGVSASKDALFAFGKLTASAVTHPIRSLFLVSAFLLARDAASDLRIPKDTENLTLYLMNRKDDLQRFIQTNGFGDNIPSEHIDMIVRMMTHPGRAIGEYLPDAMVLLDQSLKGLSEGLRLTPAEKIKMENLRGLDDFVNDLHIYHGEDASWGAYIRTAEDIQGKVARTGLFSQADIQRLETEGQSLHIKIEIRANYVWWGETNQRGEYIHENSPKCIGIDPNLSQEDQHEAAIQFMPNPNSRLESFTSSWRLVKETAGEIPGRWIEKYQEGGATAAFIDGRWILIDAMTQKYIEMPMQILTLAPFREPMAFKEFMFEYTEGLVPIMIVGTVRNIAMWRNPIGARALLDTAAYPITGMRDIYTLGRSRMVMPFYRGYSAATGTRLERMGSGLAEVFRHDPATRITEHASRVGTKMRGLLTNIPVITHLSGWSDALNKIDGLNDALAEMRQAQNFSHNLTNHLNRARGILTERGLMPLAGSLGDNIELNIRLIQEGLESQNQAIRLRSIVPSLRNTIRAGAELNGEQLIHLRDLARNTNTVDELRVFLRELTVAESKISPLVEALKNENNFLRIAEALIDTTKIRVSDNAVDMARAALEALEAGADVARAGRLSRALEMVRTGGQMTLEHLASLKNAVSRVGSPLYNQVVEGLRAIPGYTTEKVGAIIESFRSEQYLGRLMDRLRSFGNFVFQREAIEAATSIDDVIRSGRSVDWLNQAIESGRLGSGIDEIVDTSRAVVETGEIARATAHLDEALETIRSGRAITIQQLEALREAAQAENFRETLRSAGIASEHLDEVARLLREERNLGRLAEGLEATRFIKVGEGIRGLLRIGNIIPAAGMVVGVVFSVMEAREAWALAREFENNSEIRDLYNKKGWVHAGAGALMLVVDGAAIAGGIAALPVVVIMAGIMAAGRMATGMIDAQARLAMKREDYVNVAGKQGREHLLHEWYVTGQDLGADEMYDSAIDLPGSDQITVYKAQRAGTRRKLIEALITLEDGEVNPYRMKYIEATTSLLNAQSFRHAEELLIQSKAFANVMRNRNITLTRPGTPPQIFNLNESLYDANQITHEDVRAIFATVMGQNNNALRSLFGGNENRDRVNKLYGRLNSMDRNYINHVINVLYEYSLPPNSSGENREKWVALGDQLVSYLEFNNHRFTPEVIREPENEIANIEKIFFDENLSSTEIEQLKEGFSSPTKGIAALYELAKFYGYSGNPNIGRLQMFFDETHAPMYGVYWNGSEWKTNDKNGHDEGHGSDPDLAVPSIIHELETDPSDVLESYLDSSLQLRSRDDEDKRIHQVNSMRSILQSAFDSFTPLQNLRGQVYHAEQSPTAAFATGFVEGLGEEISTRNDQVVEGLDSLSRGAYSSAVNWVRSSIGGVLRRQ